MQLPGPAPNVVRLHRAQIDPGRLGKLLQALERLRVHRERAVGEPAFDVQMLQVADDVGVAGGRLVLRRIAHRRVAVGLRRRVNHSAGTARTSRASAALAISPMRMRNSVPMPAANRVESGEPSTSRPKASMVEP